MFVSYQLSFQLLGKILLCSTEASKKKRFVVVTQVTSEYWSLTCHMGNALPSDVACERRWGEKPSDTNLQTRVIHS